MTSNKKVFKKNLITASMLTALVLSSGQLFAAEDVAENAAEHHERCAC